MSGFVKRERSVNTVNPAGGINLANTPNVGQYGWTNFDSAIINQLISYVDIANSAATKAIESSEYVQSKTDEVDEFAIFITEGLADFEPKYQDSLIKYATLNDMYANMESLHEIVVKYHEDIIKIAAEVHKDSVDAKSWAYLSYINALDAKGQLTTGNAWVATPAGPFPAAPATNTIYPVTTGTADVDFGGFLWNTGDHLVYTIREAKFNQIKKDFYTFTARNLTLMDTIDEMQREISELKEMMNGYVFE